MHVIIIGIRRDHEFERAKRGTWKGLEARWRGGNDVIIVKSQNKRRQLTHRNLK